MAALRYSLKIGNPFVRIPSWLPLLAVAGAAFCGGIFVRPRIEPLLRAIYIRFVLDSNNPRVPIPDRTLRNGVTVAAPVPRFEPAAVVADGMLYLLGGFHNGDLYAMARCDVFDPKTGAWRQIADLPVTVTHAGAAVLDGEIWLAGGFVGRHPGPTANAVWRYDIARDRWSSGPLLPQARGAGGLANLNGELHFVGGLKPDRQSDASEHWVLDASSEWQPRAPLPDACNHFSAAVLNGKLHVIGGQHGHDGSVVNLAGHQVYDPASDSWRAATPLPTPRSHTEPGTFVERGMIFLAGGRAEELPVMHDLVAFDAAKGEWRSFPGLPAPMRAPVARILGGAFYYGLGGTTIHGTEPTDAWTKFPLGELALPAIAATAPE